LESAIEERSAFLPAAPGAGCRATCVGPARLRAALATIAKGISRGIPAGRCGSLRSRGRDHQAPDRWNGPAYLSQLSARTFQVLGHQTLIGRACCPQTSGNAERFIQTSLRESASSRVWANSNERTTWLPALLSYYSAGRSHSALSYRTPVSRFTGNNLLQINKRTASPRLLEGIEKFWAESDACPASVFYTVNAPVVERPTQW